MHRSILVCLLLFAHGALAARLELPLRVPLETIRQALATRLAPSPARPDEIYREGPCRYMKLGAPSLEARSGRLRLAGPGSAALGLELFGKCQNAVAWRGTMEFTLVPRIDTAGRLRLQVVDSALSEADGKPSAAGFIWELSKRTVHPQIERFSFDLGASRSRLLALLRDAAPPAEREAMEQALGSLQLLEPRVEGQAVALSLALEIPDAWLAPPAASASAAPLTEAELEALEKTLEPWDAFLVYSIRQVARDNEDAALRRRLFTLLLESRYRLVAMLSGDEPAGPEPVRSLFIDAWNELRTILADFRYATFLDAGDALVALERAAPGLDLRLTPQGLRQLARSLRPDERGDPLAYGWTVDRELQQLFGVEEIDGAPPPRSALDFFIASAQAAEVPAQGLERWVPSQDELPDYEARIAALLRKTTVDELQRASLAAPYDGIYRSLVPSTALIESCWRQYVRRAGKVSYLRSAAGSVGIMQINQHVWRGFYNVERLRWDTAYNARAGAQILMRYVKDYAIPYAERTGQPKHVPRAAYAVYNAGPRGVDRFNKARRHPREERVDERLWTLYQGIASGGEPDLGSCSVKAPNTVMR